MINAKHTPEPGPHGSLPCGCTITYLGNVISMDYCSTHAAAPELLAACIEAQEIVQKHTGASCLACDLAIAKAEGTD